MTKIAVTAASGRLGSIIVQATIEIVGKENVIGLARTPKRAESLGIEVRPGDYESLGDLEHSLCDIEALLLVSGMDAPDKRISQHRNVIKSAKRAGVRKIVYTSIEGAEENTAFSPVVQSNRQTEEDIRSSGLSWVIGRNGIRRVKSCSRAATSTDRFRTCTRFAALPIAALDCGPKASAR